MLLPFYFRWTSPTCTLSLYTPLISNYQDADKSVFGVFPLFLSIISSSVRLFVTPLLLKVQHQSGNSLLISPLLIDYSRPTSATYLRYFIYLCSDRLLQTYALAVQGSITCILVIHKETE